MESLFHVFLLFYCYQQAVLSFPQNLCLPHHRLLHVKYSPFCAGLCHISNLYVALSPCLLFFFAETQSLDEGLTVLQYDLVIWLLLPSKSVPRYRVRSSASL